MKKSIHTRQAPAAIGPYSQAIQTGNLLFASGQLGVDPQTGLLVPGGVAEQTQQVFRNLAAVLQEAGIGFQQVLKTTVFLSDMGFFTEMNQVYEQYFQAPFPARSTVAVQTLPKNALVEIECIALV